MGKKQLQRLAFKISNKFIEDNKLKAFRCNSDLIVYIGAIKEYCTNVLQKEYMANNILKFNKTINAIYPIGIVFNENILGENEALFYCDSSLNKENIDEVIAMLEENIYEFIKKHNNSLVEYYPEIKWDNFEIYIEEEKINALDNKSINKDLIKSLFIKKFALNEIYIGSSEDIKYVEDGRLVKFYPCYSYNGGYQLISEIIEITEKDKFSYTITPRVEYENDQWIIYPIIGVKRIVTKRIEDYIKYSKAKTTSILIKDDNKYYITKIKNEKSEDNNINIVKVGEHWKLYKFLEDKRGLPFDFIKKSILGEENTGIYLVYSSNSGNKMNIGSGIPGMDKIDICEYILNEIKEFELLPPLQEIKVKEKFLNKGAAISNTGKINTKNCIWRNKKTNINLLILQETDAPVSLYKEVINVLENKIFDNIDKLDDRYLIRVGEVELNLSIMDVQCKSSLETYDKENEETIAKRKAKLLKEIPEIDDSKINIAIMDIANMEEIDAKQIVRNSLDEIGIVNQCIEGIKRIDKKEIFNISNHTVSACIRDLLNDIGLGNVNQTMGKEKVIYTIHRIEGFNVVCRISDTTVEVKFTDFMNEYCHISEVYKKFNIALKEKEKFNKLKKDEMVLEQELRNKKALEIFIEDIEQDERNVITLLEKCDVIKNSPIYDLSIDDEKRIIQESSVFVKTDLLQQELLQMEENKIVKAKAIYKLDNCRYISMGEKVQSETSTANDSSKIRSWINSKDKLSIGYKQQFADRVGYEIETSIENNEIVRLIHNFRLATTSHIHLNRALTTDYIKGLEKHLKSYKEKFYK